MLKIQKINSNFLEPIKTPHSNYRRWILWMLFSIISPFNNINITLIEKRKDILQELQK